MKTHAPRNEVERQLERLQIDVTRGELARPARDILIHALWRSGMSQAAIARRLTRAAERASGEPVSRNAVQKVCARLSNGEANDERDHDQALRQVR